MFGAHSILLIFSKTERNGVDAVSFIGCEGVKFDLRAD